MLQTTATIATLISLIVSLLLLTWQTRAVAKQAKIANGVTGIQLMESVVANLRELNFLWIERPELRPYIYDGKACPRRGRRRDQILSLAESLADTLDLGLAAPHVPKSSSSGSILPNWSIFSWEMLQASPALRETVERRPHWWPDLALLLAAGSREEARRGTETS